MKWPDTLFSSLNQIPSRLWPRCSTADPQRETQKTISEQVHFVTTWQMFNSYLSKSVLAIYCLINEAQLQIQASWNVNTESRWQESGFAKWQVVFQMIHLCICSELLRWNLFWGEKYFLKTKSKKGSPDCHFLNGIWCWNSGKNLSTLAKFLLLFTGTQLLPSVKRPPTAVKSTLTL